MTIFRLIKNPCRWITLILIVDDRFKQAATSYNQQDDISGDSWQPAAHVADTHKPIMDHEDMYTHHKSPESDTAQVIVTMLSPNLPPLWQAARCVLIRKYHST